MSRYSYQSIRLPLTRWLGRSSARCWGWGGKVFSFSPRKIAQDEGGGGAAARFYIYFPSSKKIDQVRIESGSGRILNYLASYPKEIFTHTKHRFFTMDVLPQNLSSTLYFLILDHRHPKPRHSMKQHFNVKNFAPDILRGSAVGSAFIMTSFIAYPPPLPSWILFNKL